MRYASKKKIFYLVFFTAVLLLLLQPAMKTRRSYEIIEKQNIISSLHEETAENYTSTAIVDCDYHDIIYDETTLPATVIDGDLNEGYRIKEGGEYAPPECKALFSSAIIVPYRYILPYLNLIGGATSITAKQFKNINGMSNKYFGVRGDDDFFSRIESLMLKICQFEPQISEYYNIPNGHQGSWYTKNQKIFTKKGISNDGLNSLKYTEVATVLHPLFTHIMVDL